MSDLTGTAPEDVLREALSRAPSLAAYAERLPAGVMTEALAEASNLIRDAEAALAALVVARDEARRDAYDYLSERDEMARAFELVTKAGADQAEVLLAAEASRDAAVAALRDTKAKLDEGFDRERQADTLSRLASFQEARGIAREALARVTGQVGAT